MNIGSIDHKKASLPEKREGKKLISQVEYGVLILC